MNDKKKIVLATEDILAKSLEDIFINVNLQQTFNQIRREKFDNNFDLSERFRKERNASRSFRVYGIIDSTITDSDSKSIKVYSNSGLTQLIQTVQSSKIGFGDKNVFGKQRGKYLIELDNYIASDNIWLKIDSNGIDYGDTIIKVSLVFYGADGDFVEYGTDTIDIGLNGSVVTIFNDFPFFYNKHWIKSNFQIEQVLKKNISFENSSLSIDEGSSGDIVVFLNEPSFFGYESVDVSITTPSIPTYDIAAESIDFQGSGFTFPITLNWGIGEQYKTLPISAFNDFIYEKNIEYFTIGLSNNQNSTIGEGILNISSMTIDINNQDEKRFVNYNFQKIIQNTTPVKFPSLYPENLSENVSGVNLNVFGANYLPTSGISNVQNQRFYPNDTFEVEIINRGNTAILSPAPGIIVNEQVLETDQSFTFNVTSKYVNDALLPREKAVLKFKYQTTSSPLTNLYNGNFYINGIEFGIIQLSANNFIPEVNRVYGQLGIEMPFTMEQDGAEVTLTAKHPSNNINVFIPSGITEVCVSELTDNGWVTICTDENRFALTGDSQTATYPDGRVSSITDQEQFIFPLNANFANNTECRYEFKIRKSGYKEVVLPVQNISASASGSDAFLVSGLRNVIGPILDYNDPLVCSPATNAFNSTGYYLNGLALVADTVSSTSKNNQILTIYPPANALNDVSGGFVAQFRISPLTSEVIECNQLIGLSDVLS